MHYQPIIIESAKPSLSNDELAQLGIEEVANENYLRIKLEDKKTIGVKEIREVILWNSKKEERRRIILIENAENLTVQSQNALLKVLEEPNQNIQIVLVVDNIYNLLVTVRSRCRKISNKSIRERKYQEEINKFFESDYIAKEEILENILNQNEGIDSRVVLSAFLEEIIYYISENKIESFNKNKLSNMIELVEDLIEANRLNINLKIIKDLILLNL